MSFYTTTTTTVCSPVLKMDASSMVPLSSLDRQVVDMVNTPRHCGVVDYFLDVLTSTVARAMIGPQYKTAFELKTTLLTTIVSGFIDRAQFETRVILTATVYFSRLRMYLEESKDDWLCTRLAVGALMIAHKSTNEPTFKMHQWATLAQFFSKEDLKRIEREFLYLLDFAVFPTNADLRTHYDAFMRRARGYADAWSTLAHPGAGSIFTRRERAEYRYPAPSHTPVVKPELEAATDLPDLMYPDGSSDGYLSDDSSSIITPPSATSTHGGGSTKGPLSTSMLYALPPTSHPTPAYAPPQTPGYVPRTDAALDAKVRYYAADRGTVAQEYSGCSPRYVPYSPSQRPRHRHRYDRAPTPPPADWQHHGHQRGVRSASRDRNAAYGAHPWRQFQNWESTMPTNTTWGSFGLFRQ